MTIENTIKNAEAILADFHKSRAEIINRDLDNTGYMLIWKFEGSSLFVGQNGPRSAAHATGFSRAIPFRDFDAAARYVRATNIRNGRDEHPVPIKVTDAREIALADIEGVIKTMTTIVENKDQASA
jgi:hypothetical protein